MNSQGADSGNGGYRLDGLDVYPGCFPGRGLGRESSLIHSDALVHEGVNA